MWNLDVNTGKIASDRSGPYTCITILYGVSQLCVAFQCRQESRAIAGCTVRCISTKSSYYYCSLFSS